MTKIVDVETLSGHSWSDLKPDRANIKKMSCFMVVKTIARPSDCFAVVLSVGAMRQKGDVSESRKEERLVGREIIEISVVRGILAGSSCPSSTRGADSLPV